MRPNGVGLRISNAIHGTTISQIAFHQAAARQRQKVFADMTHSGILPAKVSCTKGCRHLASSI